MLVLSYKAFRPTSKPDQAFKDILTDCLHLHRKWRDCAICVTRTGALVKTDLRGGAKVRLMGLRCIYPMPGYLVMISGPMNVLGRKVESQGM